MKKLAGYFLKGLLFTIPLVITIYVVYELFLKIDGILNIPIPGLGFIVTLICITIIGFMVSTILTKGLLSFIDRIFYRLPFIKLLYSSLKDLMNALAGDKKMLDKPVMVKLSNPDIKVLGFITAESLDIINVKDHVAVYLPQAYNFAGNLIICPKENVIPINKDGAEMMKFIVSAGISGK
ncbi:MAG: DUF502 domain-containing protein [Planctomycetes bacterium]|nr:DUF502 domain-containing protein [Planctomycetota bacterium]